MKPEIKLFFDFEFTSLSPDAQPISLGIMSEKITRSVRLIPDDRRKEGETTPEFHKRANEENIGEVISSKTPLLSFYAEFSDFDLNRCDDWVKENVVGKLLMYGKTEDDIIKTLDSAKYQVLSITQGVKIQLKEWLNQFSDCNIQFVCDCGTFDWYWMLQLLAEWNKTENPDGWTGQCPTCGSENLFNYRVGLPKLPDNIYPVPEDLNDLIAHKKGISIREAFDINREELMYSLLKNTEFPLSGLAQNIIAGSVPRKHNSEWDADVIKTIYEKLKP